MLVDSHCHLDFPDFDGELEQVIERGRRAGISKFLTIGTRLTHFDAVLSVAERFDDVYCTVGVHPHEAGTQGQAGPDALIAHARHPKVVGIGETGLDYYYDKCPRADQELNFRTHISASRKTGLPLIVHARDADQDMIEILSDEMREGAFTGVMHCFSSGRELALKSIELGFYVSLSGILTFKTADELRGIVKELPLDRLLIETDAPYLAPVPHRGKRNEPAFVAETAAKLADIKGLDVAQIAEATSRNFHALFTKIPAPAVN